MSSLIIDGKKVARDSLELVKNRVDRFVQHVGRAPRAVFVTVGSNPDSQRYVATKAKRAKECGIEIVEESLNGGIKTEVLHQVILSFAKNAEIDGILLQLPLPHHLNEQDALDHIPPGKDLDGLCQFNVAALNRGSPFIVPCTPLGVTRLASYARRELSGRESLQGVDAVVVGRSSLVGKPCVALLNHAGCTTTLCHSATKDLAKHTRGADLVISATGVSSLIKADMLKRDVIAIDVGISYLEGKLVGDFDFSACKEVAGAITPVPGGVGPMTVAILLENLLFAAENGAGIPSSKEPIN